MSVEAEPPQPLLQNPPQPIRLAIGIAILGLAPGLALQLAQSAGWIAAPVTGVPLHVAFAFASLLLLAFALRWPPSAPWRPLPLRATALAWLALELLWVPLLVGYLFAARALGLPVTPQPALLTVATQGASAEAMAIAVGAVLLAPLGEELLFRGYLLGSLLPVLPRQLANVLTAIAFGLMHGRDFALPAAALGLCFGWLRLRHRSLLPSMLAHALHNALVVGVTFACPATFHWLYPS